MNEEEFLNSVIPDRAAVEYCMMLGRVSQVWDDLIDRDKELRDDGIHLAMMDALLHIPANPFFARYAHILIPMQQMVIFDWMDANDLEKGDMHDKTIAFGIRDNLVSIIVQCAYLAGGYKHARDVGPRIRRYFYDETLEEYTQ